MENTRKVVQSLFGESEASSSKTKPCFQFSSAAPSEKNYVNGGTGGAGNGEGEAAPLGVMFDLKRFNRIQRNRVHAQRSRLKKMKHVSDLEVRAKSLQTNITAMLRQLGAYREKQQLLRIEQATLKLKIAASEKQRVLQEDEIEKSKAKLNKLWLLQNRQELSQVQGRMPNPNTGKQLMSI
ncbi:hypothetical protein L6164_028694 [Bauhinia variegata]|uniref:Uncharacterized protein n=1 Tax=Bauhinia variegata TaxID=167791 RepID=A0ACB9L8A7_BAUVA|nr:hypothetical protein L6164_028694 [Bauhinia variegata]